MLRLTTRRQPTLDRSLTHTQPGRDQPRGHTARAKTLDLGIAVTALLTPAAAQGVELCFLRCRLRLARREQGRCDRRGGDLDRLAVSGHDPAQSIAEIAQQVPAV